ncbi:unnamed protein product [Diamesa serratosioi]
MNMKLDILLIASAICCVLGLELPKITENPSDMVVPRHDPATLNCKAEGAPKPTIEWFKDGELLKIEAGSHRMQLPAGGLFFLKVVHSRRESDAGIYWCEARNELGVTRSRNATLQVAVLRDEFRLDPQNTRLAQGETVLLECGPPKGSPEPVITWRKNGQTMDLTGSKRIRIVDGGNLAIQEARQSDDGRYQCIAKNVVGVRESIVAYLKVHVKPFLIRGPQNQTAVTGSSIVFQCRVGGEPLPDVLWRRTASGGNMPLGRVHILEDRSLKIDNVTMDDIGEYSCEADNSVGSVVSSGMLLVFSPPTFTIRPKLKIGELGSEVFFECQATGYPEPTLFWTIEGNRSLIFPGFHSKNIEASATSDGGSILSITEIDRTDNGKIIVCSAVNSVGSVSTRVMLSVNLQDDSPPPLIAQGPVNQTLPIKSVATLPCRVYGNPKPIVSWYKDGIPVSVSDKIDINENGMLTITDLSKIDDTGLYTCVASSKSGKSTWSAFLRLESPTNPNIQFFRAPDSSAYPGQPGKPQIIEKSDSSVTLSWIRSNAIGSSSLLGYTVEIFGRNSTEGWTQVAHRIQNTTYEVTGLTVGISYYFVVRAENSHGMSGSSQLSEPVTIGMNEINSDLDMSEARASLLSGDVVELLNATSSDSTSMKLLWEIINGKYVEGFYIYARDVDDDTAESGESTYKMLTVLNAGASSCNINGLEKYTTYEFFIVPFYKAVEGKPSNSRIASTLEDVPSEAPFNMEALLLNSSSVYVKWSAPRLEAQNGVLLNYLVIVRGVNIYENISKVLTNITINAATSSLMLANLTEGVTYTVSVAAANNAGLGPFSKPAVLRLDPITKQLDTSYNQRFPINSESMDDFLTQPWFIILLAVILMIIMLSFGTMVFIKRKHITMKQSRLAALGGSTATGVMKFPSLPAGGGSDGYWLDPSGIVWQSNQRKINHIPDYAPVYTSTTTTTLPNEEDSRNRYMGEYTDYPADYAEVTSFKRSPSEYSRQSPTPYATATLISTNNMNRCNMFYTTDVYPPNAAVPNQINNNNNNNNNNNYSRNVYSESYYTPNGKVNISENRMTNTMAPNMYKHNTASKMKQMRPQNFRLNFGNPNEQEQVYIKVGELNPQIQPSSTLQTPQSQHSNSMIWNSQNFNIYENHLHDHQTNGNGNEGRNNVEKDYSTGNRNVINYPTANDYPEDV